MRTKKEINQSLWSSIFIPNIIVELLLDIRELLINDSEYIKGLNLAKVKVVDGEEELDKEVYKKYIKIIEEEKNE